MPYSGIRGRARVAIIDIIRFIAFEPTKPGTLKQPAQKHRGHPPDQAFFPADFKRARAIRIVQLVMDSRPMIWKRLAGLRSIPFGQGWANPLLYV